MTTTVVSPTVPTSAGTDSPGLYRTAAVLLVIEFLLIFAPMIILGGAIGWPGNLDEPASVNLPLLLEQFPAVISGYSFYLVYSLLFWPVAYYTGRVIVGANVNDPLFRVAGAFAALSAMARALGIVRWLFAMPVLAHLYTAEDADPVLQQTISVVYDMLNSYAGGVGELLGVSLFAVIWLVLIGVLILRTADWPNWLGYFAFIAAASLFANLAEIVGVDMGINLTLSVTLLQFWMLAAAILFWRRRSQM